MAKYKTGERVKYIPPNGWSPVVASVRKEKRGYSVVYNAQFRDGVKEVRAWIHDVARLSRDMAGAEGYTRLAGLDEVAV